MKKQQTVDQALIENWPTLQEILDDPFIKRLLRCYLTDERSEENLDFLEAVEVYEFQYEKMTPKLRIKAIEFIKDQYLDKNAEKQVNLSYEIQQRILKKLSEIKEDAPQDIFTEAKNATKYLLFTEQYTYFLNKLNSNAIGTGKKDIYTLYLNQHPQPRQVALYPPLLTKTMEVEKQGWKLQEKTINKNSLNECIQDLVDDEKEYVSLLTMLIELSNILTKRGVVDEDICNELFDHIDVIINHHQKFVGILSDTSKTIGMRMNEGLHFLVLYRYYLRHVPGNIGRLCREVLESDDHDVVKETYGASTMEEFCKQLKVNKKTSILQLMLLPFFRVNVYQNYVEEFLKLTKKETQDYKDLELVKVQLGLIKHLVETYAKSQKIQRMNDCLKILFPFSFAAKTRLFMHSNEIMGMAVLDRYDTTDISQMAMSTNSQKKVTLIIMSRGIAVTELTVINNKKKGQFVDKTFFQMVYMSDVAAHGRNNDYKIIYVDIPQEKKRIWFGCVNQDEYQACCNALIRILGDN